VARQELPLLLLVDDSEAILSLERAALGGTYRLESAANGLLAMEFMRRQVPDAVLLDLSMPEMDGDAVLQSMRRDPGLRDVPVLVVSTESQRARDTMRMGADDFLPKPVAPDDLRRRVALVLEIGERRKAARLKAFLFFRAAGMEMGLPLERVFMVVARPALRGLPGAPPASAAYFELYGETVPVLDFAVEFDRPSALPEVQRKIVVVECRGRKVGLETEEVWDPEDLEQSLVQDGAPYPAATEVLGRRRAGMATGSRGSLPVLHVERLFSEDAWKSLLLSLAGVPSPPA
jgi:CheY-like chemotaxis protein